MSQETTLLSESNTNREDETKSLHQQLVDAQAEIAELKMHIDWLERAYE